jgi:hypothetical protein
MEPEDSSRPLQDPHQRAPSRARRTQFTSSDQISLKDAPIYAWVFRVVSSLHAFRPKCCRHFSSFRARYMLRPSQPSLFDHSNKIRSRAQIMELPIMQFSPASCHFTSLGFKFSSKNEKTTYSPKIIFLLQTLGLLNKTPKPNSIRRRLQLNNGKH